MRITKTEIFDRIKDISFSNGKKFADLMSEIIIKGEDIGFSLDITDCSLSEAKGLQQKAIYEIKSMGLDGKVSIALTSSKKGEEKHIIIEGAGKVIMVASGKGGVGKSTIATCLAQSLAKEGAKVGLLDADIYGPSIPTIFGASGKPEFIDKRMIPIKAQGVYLNSIGFLIEPGESVPWRGPMVSKALYQLISLTRWPDLDYLIIDTPPGTGDIHLSIIQNYQINGGVLIVTDPSRLSEVDASKAISLYKKFGLDFLGIVENFNHDPQKEGAGARLARAHGIENLFFVPYDPEMAEKADRGEELGSFLPGLLVTPQLFRA